MPSLGSATSVSTQLPIRTFELPRKENHVRIVHRATIASAAPVFTAQLKESLKKAATSSMPWNLPNSPPKTNGSNIIAWDVAHGSTGIVSSLSLSNDGILELVEFLNHDPIHGGVAIEVAYLEPILK